MRILHVAYSLGDSSAATRLARSQADEHDVYFALCRRSDTSFVRQRQVGVLGFFLLGIGLQLLEIALKKLLRIRSDEVFSFGILAGLPRYLLIRAVKRHAIDVVHAHWGGYGFMSLSSLDSLPIPVIITAHDYQYFTGGCHVPMEDSDHRAGCRDCPLTPSAVGKALIRRVMRDKRRRWLSSDISVVAPSTYTAELIAELHPHARISIVPNTYGITYPPQSREAAPSSDEHSTLAAERLNPDFPTIMTVGVVPSSRDNKGFGTLTHVLNRLREAGVRFNLICVGEDVGTLAPPNYLHFPFLHGSALTNLYPLADLCLVPSKFETFSQVTMESIISGTPVIAFDRSGPRDIIEVGRTGFLVPSFDEEAFARRVLDSMEFKTISAREFDQGAARARLAYSATTVVSQVDDVYRRLLA